MPLTEGKLPRAISWGFPPDAGRAETWTTGAVARPARLMSEGRKRTVCGPARREVLPVAVAVAVRLLTWLGRASGWDLAGEAFSLQGSHDSTGVGAVKV
ncbi:hypothetical protein [Thermogemmatispora sp.]|uniref:hypothetical protein n=1 Tax=Thermogemmatispora sp. TaxID=1968838 RepID=UPI0035E44B84